MLKYLFKLNKMCIMLNNIQISNSPQLHAVSAGTTPLFSTKNRFSRANSRWKAYKRPPPPIKNRATKRGRVSSPTRISTPIEDLGDIHKLIFSAFSALDSNDGAHFERIECRLAKTPKKLLWHKLTRLEKNTTSALFNRLLNNTRVFAVQPRCFAAVVHFLSLFPQAPHYFSQNRKCFFELYKIAGKIRSNLPFELVCNQYQQLHALSPKKQYQEELASIWLLQMQEGFLLPEEMQKIPPAYFLHLLCSAVQKDKTTDLSRLYASNHLYQIVQPLWEEETSQRFALHDVAYYLMSRLTPEARQQLARCLPNLQEETVARIPSFLRQDERTQREDRIVEQIQRLQKGAARMQSYEESIRDGCLRPLRELKGIFDTILEYVDFAEILWILEKANGIPTL